MTAIRSCSRSPGSSARSPRRGRKSAAEPLRTERATWISGRQWRSGITRSGTRTPRKTTRTSEAIPSSSRLPSSSSWKRPAIAAAIASASATAR